KASAWLVNRSPPISYESPCRRRKSWLRRRRMRSDDGLHDRKVCRRRRAAVDRESDRRTRAEVPFATSGGGSSRFGGAARGGREAGGGIPRGEGEAAGVVGAGASEEGSRRGAFEGTRGDLRRKGTIAAGVAGESAHPP